MEELVKRICSSGTVLIFWVSLGAKDTDGERRGWQLVKEPNSASKVQRAPRPENLEKFVPSVVLYLFCLLYDMSWPGDCGFCCTEPSSCTWNGSPSSRMWLNCRWRPIITDVVCRTSYCASKTTPNSMVSKPYWCYRLISVWAGLVRDSLFLLHMALGWLQAGGWDPLNPCSLTLSGLWAQRTKTAVDASSWSSL